MADVDMTPAPSARIADISRLDTRPARSSSAHATRSPRGLAQQRRAVERGRVAQRRQGPVRTEQP